MASSNRHWPSMFKSKPPHHQWQNDITPPCNKTPYSPGPGCEERTPEPKPRWNPRPEQIRILEAIFNSGMVNPPRDEIRKIRVQLQEYGQVGDANVFYWFQNRKSRSKHKLRQLHNAKPQPQQPPPHSAIAPSSSSSSSSNNSSPNDSSEKSLSLGPTAVIDLLNSPTASVNQPYFQPANEFLSEPFFFPVHHNTVGFPADVADQTVENANTCSGFLYSELMRMSEKKQFEDEKMKLPQQITSYPPPPVTDYTPPLVPPPSLPDYNLNFQGVEDAGPTKSTVFINDVCFEVGVGPFNVREAFGDDAVLIGSTGQAVLTNEWGVTVQPLQHGAFYYLIRPFTTPSPHDRTIDLCK
ncbi:hypothetical protein ACS0TY_032183 [Phlomoides rotata]